MADSIVKPNTGNDLVLQNDDASAKVEVNEDGTVVVSASGVDVNLGSGAGDDFTVDTDKMVVEGDRGYMTTPSQASFNVVGDGGAAQAIGTSGYHKVEIWTERFDIGTNFASDQFNAPVDGKYILTAYLYVYGYTTGDNLAMRIYTSNYQYLTQISASDGGSSMLEISIVAEMEEADVAKVEIGNQSAARGNVASSLGYFSGMLIG